MNFILRIHPDVEDDILSSYKWYESKSPGLGEELMGIFYSSIDSIMKNPFQNAKKYGEFRRYLIFKFPYAIYYLCNRNTVIITGFFHYARDPNVLQSKLNKRNDNT